jgi:lysophospholipase L1-like esterase
MKLVLSALALALGALPAQSWAGPACTPHWVAAWASSQFQPDAGNALPNGSFAGNSLRQILHLSLGGQRLRLRLSNLAGTRPLALSGAALAPALPPGTSAIASGNSAIASGNSAIAPGTSLALSFDGAPGVVLPAGGDYLSDPLALPTKALGNMALTIAFADEPSPQTSHPGARATSYLAAGDQRTSATLPGAQSFDHWFAVSGVEVERCGPARVIVALGDSITDGRGSTTNGNNRWPDLLAERLQATPGFANVAVVNQGIGGNRLLDDGLGPSALARFDRDVLATSGVTHLVVLEGINDIGTFARTGPAQQPDHDRLVARIIGAYRQMIARAHAHGIKAVGATITPFAGSDYYHPLPANEADRQAVNRWIRTPGNFDAVVDFDAALRDPAQPSRLRPAYDSGDHLHPNPAGYRAMAQAVPLRLFR